ncbi:hypothetical protein Hanom_Chr04g00338011 [Helianthus anomalus]
MDGRSNRTEKSSSCATGKVSGKYLVYKKKHDEYPKNSVEHRRSYSSSSPYYKGLLCHEKVSTEPDSTTPVVHDVQNLPSPSPYYKGLLYTERVDTGTTFEVETTTAVPHEYLVSPYYKGLLNTERVDTGTSTGTSFEVETTAAIPHEYLVSPYYKGLLYTERVDTGTGTGTTFEVETTAAIPHECLVSPYYKGLLNSATSPDCHTTNASSSSRMKKSQFGFFKFKAKDERPKPPTMVKVYSTENSSNQVSGGSEPTSPQFSPPLSIPEPPSELPVPQPIVLQFHAFGALSILG